MRSHGVHVPHDDSGREGKVGGEFDDHLSSEAGRSPSKQRQIFKDFQRKIPEACVS